MNATRALYDLVYGSYKCFKKCNATYDAPCRWPMTHDNDIWDKCDICHKCDTLDPWPLSHCDTMWQKSKNKIKKCTNMLIINEIDVTHCDTMWYFDMFVTSKVFQLIGPSNDGRRHGRGTYLYILHWQIGAATSMSVLHYSCLQIYVIYLLHVAR
jgi:hypothetical protein